MTTAAVAVVTRGARARRGPGSILLPVGFILIVLVLQELLTRGGILPAGYFPPVSATLAALAGELTGSTLYEALFSTLTTWLLALVTALVLGTAGGVVLGLVVPLEALLRPAIEFLRPVPSVALIPLVVLTTGTGSEGALFLAVFAAFWQVLIPAIAGVRAVHPTALDTARSYSFTPWQRVRWIRLPAMLPHLATATRLATSTALILVVTAEIIIQMPGIGSEITMSRTTGNPPRMYAYIMLSGVAGIVLNTVVRRIEKRLFATHGLQEER